MNKLPHFLHVENDSVGQRNGAEGAAVENAKMSALKRLKPKTWIFSRKCRALEEQFFLSGLF